MIRHHTGRRRLLPALMIVAGMVAGSAARAAEESPGQPGEWLSQYASARTLGLGNAFAVRDSVTGELLAAMKKPYAADWLVHDAAGDLAAVVTRTSAGLGTATYVAMAAERPVASFTWSNVLRPSLEIDLSRDADRWLDRRLGVALGVLLFVNLSFRA